MTGQSRAHWSSRLGFVLAAAGSAIGLGNIWKFPYVTGENGGGLFVLIYLGCIAVVGLPIFMAEVFIGRAAQCSPVGAFRSLARPGSPWILTGWLGVVTAFVILSYYSVVAGWSLHYVWLSIRGAFNGVDADRIAAVFGDVYVNPAVNIGWHLAFMGLTIAIVAGGVKAGIERWSRILLPALFLMMIALLVRAVTTEGFRPALKFVFGFHADQLTAAGILEALGHAFFTLSLGMGAMITYGSYLNRNDDLVATSVTVGILDTTIALLACMVLFPITFTFGMPPAAGPGLVFQNMPIAFSQLPFGMFWSALFFTLIAFAALTSTISLLEVAASYFIDERNWTRSKATVVCGIGITLLGIPSALSGGTDLFGARVAEWTGRLGLKEGAGLNWFDLFDYLASNWMLPLGGLFISLFVAWRVGAEAREQGFKAGTRWASLYWGWVFLLRYIVPIAVLAVFLHAIGVV